MLLGDWQWRRKKGKPVFHAAVYARMSSENRGEESLETQISLLKEYIRLDPGMVLEEVYSDFGYTGTNFDRPRYQEMMGDVKKGWVNCIVIKDLSHLGRNYIEMRQLVETVLPFLGVRLISVSDGVDTEKENGQEMLVASLKNLVNDMYSRDLSEKLTSVMAILQKEAEKCGKGAYGKGGLFCSLCVLWI